MEKCGFTNAFVVRGSVRARVLRRRIAVAKSHEITEIAIYSDFPTLRKIASSCARTCVKEKEGNRKREADFRNNHAVRRISKMIVSR